MNHESGYERAHRQAEHIFRNLLPAHGMAVREGQIALCHAMPRGTGWQGRSKYK